MSVTQTPPKTEMRRVGKFGLVGALNTIMDFTVYNVMHFGFGFGLIRANVISTTLAMIFSFYMNKKVVFKHHHGSMVRQGIAFLLITAFGLYVLQNGVIAILTDIWVAPMQLVVELVHMAGLQHTFSDTFIINNGAKAVATVVSMTWNYLFYKRVVFQ